MTTPAQPARASVADAIREALEMLAGTRAHEASYLSLRAALARAEALEALAEAAERVLQSGEMHLESASSLVTMAAALRRVREASHA